MDCATHRPGENGGLGLVVDLGADAGDETATARDGHGGVGVGDLVVRGDMQDRCRDNGRRLACEAAAHDLDIAFEAHMRAVLVHLRLVGGEQRGRVAVVGDARQFDVGAVVVREMFHALGDQRMLERAVGTETPQLEVVDDEVGVVALLAVGAAGAGLRCLFEPEGQRREHAEQRQREQRGAAASHFR